MADNSNLLARGLNAAKWNYLGNAFKVLLQFLIGIWLARLLGPEAFGVVAVAWLMIGAGKLISNFGFSAALIQRPDLTDQDVGFVFTVQMLIGLALSLLSFVFSSQIAAFFNHPPAEPIIAVMAWLFLIQAVGQTTTAALNRALRFKFSQVVSVITYLVGYVGIGLPMAYIGYGAWSLVAAQMIQAVAYTVIVLVKSGIAIRPRFRPSKPGLFGFGSKVVGANISSWGISNLDSVVIGRLLGVVNLGLYNRAMTLVATPMNAVTSSLQSVLFSMCSKAQHDHQKVTLAYLAVTELLAYICLPVFFTIAVVPETVALGLYGDKWAAIVPLLVPLAIAMPINALLAVIGPVLMAIDKTQVELKAQLVSLLTMLPVLVVAAQYSIKVIAWSILLVYFLRWLLLFLGVRSELGIKWHQLLDALIHPTIVGVIVAAVTYGINNLLPPINMFLRLAALIFVAALVLAGVLRTFGPRIMVGPIGQALKGRQQLPKVVTYWLRLKAT